MAVDFGGRGRSVAAEGLDRAARAEHLVDRLVERRVDELKFAQWQVRQRDALFRRLADQCPNAVVGGPLRNAAGDQVFLFGFSRGATTVRSLSSFIDLFGILPKSRPELIKRAYKIYKTRNRAKRNRLADEFVNRNHTMWCRINFLGVWDTVAALGIPFKSLDVLVDKVPFFRHDYQDLRLSDSVQNGRHALAIDDERLLFHPTLWDRELIEHQTMKQVWFCGMHTDVGGAIQSKICRTSH